MFEGMERIEFEHEGTLLRGYVAPPDAPGPAPAVLVMHSALGVAPGVNEQVARKFAAEGYVAVCTDMYGAHLDAPSMDEAGQAYPLDDVDALRQEMRDAGVRDYQITVFGGTAHGFTDPEAADLQLEGVEYHQLSNDLSWTGTLVLLEHFFGR